MKTSIGQFVQFMHNGEVISGKVVNEKFIKGPVKLLDIRITKTNELIENILDADVAYPNDYE